MTTGCSFIFITGATPDKRSIGAVNGIGQLSASIVRAIAPAGASSLYNELVTKKSEDGAGGEENTINLRELICTTLDVPSEDLSDDVQPTAGSLYSVRVSVPGQVTQAFGG